MSVRHQVHELEGTIERLGALAEKEHRNDPDRAIAWFDEMIIHVEETQKLLACFYNVNNKPLSPRELTQNRERRTLFDLSTLLELLELLSNVGDGRDQAAAA